MSTEKFEPLKGHCTCKAVTYEVSKPFLITHCCHCTWCQRETGTAFALNCFTETEYFHITSETKPVTNDLPTASGAGQMMARCPKCLVVLYSDYGEDGTWSIAVRWGTLDDEGKKAVKPDVHIWTSTKVDWIDLAGEVGRGIPIFTEYYKTKDVWSKDSLERLEALKRRIGAAKKDEVGKVDA